MTNFLGHLPPAGLIGKIIFFFFVFLGSVALFVGIVLSFCTVEPAGSITIGGALVFAFGVVIGLATTLRDVFSTFNLTRKPTVPDAENMLELKELPPGPSTRGEEHLRELGGYNPDRKKEKENNTKRK